CAQCHIPARYDTPAHHHHAVGSTGSRCIECHMPSKLYMVIDRRRDHSFRVPRPDLSVELGTPNACNHCHTGEKETPQWAADAVHKWYGGPNAQPPHDWEGIGAWHWASAFAAGRAAKPEGEKLLLELLNRPRVPDIVRATAIDLLANYRSLDSEKTRQAAV